MFSQEEIAALADELRTEDPTLSLDQALDAATAMQAELLTTIHAYNTDRIIQLGQLVVYAQAWDSDVRSGVRIAVCTDA